MSQKKYRYIIPIGLFIFNVIDLLTTVFFISKYGVDIEQNPIAKWSINNLGGWATSYIKIVTSFICCFLIYKCWEGLVENAGKRFLILLIYFSYLFLASYYIGGLFYYFFLAD